MEQPDFSERRSRVLFTEPYLPEYDVSADGERFLMVQATEDALRAPTHLDIVLNWTEELKRLVPVE